MYEDSILISDKIDYQIVLIANALESGMNDDSIIQTFLIEGFTTDDMYLLLNAGKLLYHDRKTAIPTKKIFRRVP